MKASNSLSSLIPTAGGPIARSSSISTYNELRQRIHEDLRTQHPEWVEPNGDSPICDLYERRFAELITFFQSGERKLVAA